MTKFFIFTHLSKHLTLGVCTALLFCCIITSVAQAPIKADSLAQTTNAYTILEVKEMHSQKDTIRLGEFMAIKFKQGDSIEKITTLLLDGIEVKTKPWKTSPSTHTIFYKVDEEMQQLAAEFLVSEALNNNYIKVSISVGDGKQFSNSTLAMYFAIKQKIKNAWIWIVLLLIPLLFFIYLSLKHNILKDDGNVYYSLGRTQLFFWTVIFCFCYLYLWLKTGTLPDITNTVLILLGVSVATTAAAKVIENNPAVAPPAVADQPVSEGWLIDILSDSKSISVHRFQNVAFTLVYGVIFIQQVGYALVFPEFDTNALLLMGISSGTYAGLKITEAK